MSEHPTPAAVRSPASPREALADRFLARVAALSPEEWGRLDAIGQRFTASDPLARWRRAARLSAFGAAVPWARPTVALLGFATAGIADAARLATGRPLAPWGMRRPPPADAGAPPDARALAARLQTLWDTASLQPGGGGPALACLALALVALWNRPRLPEAGFAELYELVEPVIPLASLRR